jgi:hypothetical protein
LQKKDFNVVRETGIWDGLCHVFVPLSF